jgi:hypothetical protein
MKCFIMLVWLLGGSIWTYAQQKEEAQDIALEDPQMSRKYFKGGYLMYDCYDRHWVCTTKAMSNACDDQREKAIDRNSLKLPCATWQSYADHDTCAIEQKRLVELGMQFSFCTHQRAKKHFIEF